MSSYLNIYLKVKNKEMKEPSFIFLDSFSRNSDIYQSVDEQGNFYSINGQKRELTNGIFQDILEDLQGQINNCQLYIDTAREVKSPDVQDIVEQRKYLKELESTRDYFSFLYGILKDKEYNDIEGIYCFID